VESPQSLFSGTGRASRLEITGGGRVQDGTERSRRKTTEKSIFGGKRVSRTWLSVQEGARSGKSDHQAGKKGEERKKKKESGGDLLFGGLPSIISSDAEGGDRGDLKTKARNMLKIGRGMKGQRGSERWGTPSEVWSSLEKNEGKGVGRG